MNETEWILAPQHLPILSGFALGNVLLAFDYDGTLAPITLRPRDAHMRPETERLLARVARAYPTIVISGRALADVSALLRRVPLWHIYGNHGLEAPGQQTAQRPDIRAWVTALRRPLARWGIRVEDKGHTLTLHFRGVPDREGALDAIHAAIADLPDVTVLRGREAINLLPRGGGDKGVALTQARHAFACHQVIYVGDEDTDEAAFAVGGADTLAIRVEPSTGSAARYHLGSQMEIDILLQALFDIRRPAHERRDRSSHGS